MNIKVFINKEYIMKKIINLTESDLTRIVRRVIREQINLPTCISKMANDGKPGSDSEMSGSYTKITFNGTVSPESQGYTVHTANGPFCFVPTGGGNTPPQPPRPQVPRPPLWLDSSDRLGDGGTFKVH